MLNTDKIKNILGVIFLGALGSGLWSTLGEPTAGLAYDHLQLFGGEFANKVADFINNGVGSGGWEDRGSAFFLIASIFVLFLFLVKSLVPLLPRFRYKIILVLVTMLIPISFGYKVLYAHKLTLYFDKNIEILAPYMTESELLFSKSYYRLIDDSESLADAQNYLLEKSERYGISVQRFSL
ncbi:hypothetical protein [Vibrio kanaloae]|uniref:hypothetical protein n=1 Tax=Vibrio kanaloae TaxID=170673 RepID=UPI0011B36807|nr:hypothetical protein [Vibrio kanaloae]